MFRFSQHKRKIHRDELRAMNARACSVYSDSASATAGGRCRCIGLPICRLLVGGLRLNPRGCLSRFVVSCPGGLLRFLTATFDGFLGLFVYSLSGVLGFLSDGFGGLLGFLIYGFDSFFNFFACFLRPMLYVLDSPLLSKRGERSGRY